MSKYNLKDVNTVVVASNEEKFKDVFIGENRWFPLVLQDDATKYLKYIAIYRNSPVSGISHYGEIEGIIPHVGKYHTYDIIIKKGSIIKLNNVVTKEIGKPGPRGLLYTTLEKLLAAKKIPDL